MKNFLSLAFLFINMLPLSVFSQNTDEPVALGLPGDNLNLYAVLDIFQKSPTLEEFEKSINDKDTKINNLDLNNDKQVDYISVINLKEGSSHSIVLRVAINDKENQDVAVIEVSKEVNGKVSIQIIGDKNLYGKNYIIEPSNNTIVEGTPNPGYIENDNVVYYVNDWPLVIHLFSPAYVVYTSPWYWGYYPSYWNPWVPVYYHNYWAFHSHYYHNRFYRRISYVRYPNNYRNYTSTRNSSTRVTRNTRRGVYDATYNGRTYSRPTAPVIRRTNTTDRQITPSTRTRTTTKKTTTTRNETRRKSSTNDRKRDQTRDY